MKLQIEATFMLAQQQPQILRNIVDFLNGGNKDDAMQREKDELLPPDQVLENIRNLTERTGRELKSISPDVLRHIDRFENLNNFEKEIVCSTAKPPDLSPVKKKRSKIDGGVIERLRQQTQEKYEQALVEKKADEEDRQLLKDSLKKNIRDMLQNCKKHKVEALIADHK